MLSHFPPLLCTSVIVEKCELFTQLETHSFSSTCSPAAKHRVMIFYTQKPDSALTHPIADSYLDWIATFELNTYSSCKPNHVQISSLLDEGILKQLRCAIIIYVRRCLTMIKGVASVDTSRMCWQRSLIISGRQIQNVRQRHFQRRSGKAQSVTEGDG